MAWEECRNSRFTVLEGVLSSAIWQYPGFSPAGLLKYGFSVVQHDLDEFIYTKDESHTVFCVIAHP